MARVGSSAEMAGAGARAGESAGASESKGAGARDGDRGYRLHCLAITAEHPQHVPHATAPLSKKAEQRAHTRGEEDVNNKQKCSTQAQVQTKTRTSMQQGWRHRASARLR